VLARSRVAHWARHWPLAFLGLAALLFLRADPENWPLGPRSFWTELRRGRSTRAPGIRLVDSGARELRLGRASGTDHVAACAVRTSIDMRNGRALLLTHSHSLANVKEELLAGLSHIPLAILAVIAGWARWLELRLPPDQRRIPAWIWPLSFVLIGIVLLNYRES